MRRQDFSYDLPEELIAQSPLKERSASRLLVLDGATGGLADRQMADLPEYLRSGDLLVFNDTRVVAARIVGSKPSGGRVEIFLERVVPPVAHVVQGEAGYESTAHLGEGQAGGESAAHAVGESRRADSADRQQLSGDHPQRSQSPVGDSLHALVQLRASKTIRVGLEITTPGGIVRVVGREDELWRVETPIDALEFFETWGEVPLPPYIHRAADASDRERYQSIFAREKGAVAAPTASLHFDAALVSRLEKMGVGHAFVTLHVGAGTFQPVRTDDLDAHKMHAERVSVSAATWEAIQRTRTAGGRVIAVGTTVVRALESAALEVALRAAERARTSEAGVAREFATVAADAICATSSSAAAAEYDAAGAAPRPRTPATAADHDSADTAAGSAAAGAATAGDAAATGAAATRSPPIFSTETRLFIRPGFKFQLVDAMVTNFHLPESTLLMLVSAFAGREQVLAAYAHAVRERYRFFSYGDAMLVMPTQGAL